MRLRGHRPLGKVRIGTALFTFGVGLPSWLIIAPANQRLPTIRSDSSHTLFCALPATKAAKNVKQCNNREVHPS